MGYGDIIREVVNCNGKTIPIKIYDEDLPVENPKVTHREKIVYIGLVAKEFRKGIYLIAKKNTFRGVAPIGAIVKYFYRTGSWRHASLLFQMYFKVIPNEEKKIVIDDEENISIRIKNLEPLPELTEEQITEARAEIINKGWILSDFDPVDKLYYYWVKQKERKPIKIFTFNIFSIDDINKAISELQQFKQQLLSEHKRVKTVVKSI